MYACTLETGRGFFEEVCRSENQPLLFRDPPLPFHSRLDFREVRNFAAGSKGDNGAGRVRRLPRSLDQVPGEVC